MFCTVRPTQRDRNGSEHLDAPCYPSQDEDECAPWQHLVVPERQPTEAWWNLIRRNSRRACPRTNRVARCGGDGWFHYPWKGSEATESRGKCTTARRHQSLNYPGNCYQTTKDKWAAAGFPR